MGAGTAQVCPRDRPDRDPDRSALWPAGEPTRSRTPRWIPPCDCDTQRPMLTPETREDLASSVRSGLPSSALGSSVESMMTISRRDSSCLTRRPRDSLSSSLQCEQPIGPASCVPEVPVVEAVQPPRRSLAKEHGGRRPPASLVETLSMIAKQQRDG